VGDVAVPLGEDRADRPGDHLGVALRDGCEDVAHEVDPAPCQLAPSSIEAI
jgi:hypothetical protein